jgi:protein-S-isoprenylcysteine O-methyltransferase Ste14
MRLSDHSHADRHAKVGRWLGLLYAWSGFLIMWGFWICFIVFLANPRWAESRWPLSTVDAGGADLQIAAAVIIDLVLISLFGLQHSAMARPWFKARVMAALPPAFERCTFVHAANFALLALIVLWQPIPFMVWDLPFPYRAILWSAFAAGWIILLLGALSFGLFDLLGVSQMRAWYRGEPSPVPRLKTGLLYTVFRHPMYVGVLLAIWATPRMTAGHLLLAVGMTIYVVIGMRYEERDLAEQFGAPYMRWRAQP